MSEQVHAKPRHIFTEILTPRNLAAATMAASLLVASCNHGEASSDKPACKTAYAPKLSGQDTYYVVPVKEPDPQLRSKYAYQVTEPNPQSVAVVQHEFAQTGNMPYIIGQPTGQMSEATLDGSTNITFLEDTVSIHVGYDAAKHTVAVQTCPR